jgi:hypothetical protein
MNDLPERLDKREERVLARWSGTEDLPSTEVAEIVESGRRASLEAESAGYPDIPHLEQIVSALPSRQRNPFFVGRFLENATITHPTLLCEVGVSEYLRSGADDLEPILVLARQADHWGM